MVEGDNVVESVVTSSNWWLHVVMGGFGGGNRWVVMGGFGVI